MVKFVVNEKEVELDIPSDVPLLWALREELQLTGTKFGCGKGLCGACTVHLNGAATRSCILPSGAIEGQKVTTIEGIAESDQLHPVQKEWIKANAPQCGYCQSGQIMQAVGALNQNPQTEDEAVAAMGNNICRCGSYHKIKEALLSAMKEA